MYAGVFAIMAFFTVTPPICELCVYLYNRNGGSKD